MPSEIGQQSMGHVPESEDAERRPLTTVPIGDTISV
jgi:hypothetical protein